MILIKKAYFEEFLSVVCFLKKKKKIFLVKIENKIIRFFYLGEVEVVYKKKIDFEGKIEILIEYEHIEKIIKNLKNDFYVNINLKDKSVNIRENKFFFSSNCIINNNYCYISSIKKKKDLVNKIYIESSIFLECFDYSFFFEKTFLVKKQGINLFFYKRKFNCFSTDGFRAIFYKNEMEYINDKSNIFIKKDLVVFINRIIRKRKYSSFFIKEFKKFILISFRDFKIYSTDTFKKNNDYKSIIKINKDYKKIKLNNSLFLDSIKKFDFCSLEKNSKLKIVIKKTELIISHNNEKIFLKDKIPILKFQGYKKDVTLFLNFNYIKDFLNINKSLIFCLSIIDKKSMIYLSSKNASLIYCFMPIN
ncbi:DNA polymerase III beta subunit [Candidatus Vidania fulgoroideae]|nr:DNA polymerase III beta subunit [Candidatus Vidania fulgoroideae]